MAQNASDLTIQQCSLLSLVVIYVRYILLATLSLAKVAVFLLLYRRRIWTYRCLPAYCCQRSPKTVVILGGAIMKFSDDQCLPFVTWNLICQTRPSGHVPNSYAIANNHARVKHEYRTQIATPAPFHRIGTFTHLPHKSPYRHPIVYCPTRVCYKQIRRCSEQNRTNHVSLLQQYSTRIIDGINCLMKRIGQYSPIHGTRTLFANMAEWQRLRAILSQPLTFVYCHRLYDDMSRYVISVFTTYRIVSYITTFNVVQRVYPNLVMCYFVNGIAISFEFSMSLKVTLGVAHCDNSESYNRTRNTRSVMKRARQTIFTIAFTLIHSNKF